MTEHSRILIIDLVLPNKAASQKEALLDFSMMTMCAGMERTESQWCHVLESTGLEVVKIWKTKDAEAVVEVRNSA